MDNQELFQSSMTDEPIEAVVEVEAPEPEASSADGVNRDEQGRFAPKADQPEAAAGSETAPQGKEDDRLPSWRGRELRERAEAAEARARDVEARYQRQLQELQSRLPKVEAPPAPDVFEDPNKFLEHGVRQAIAPVETQIGRIVESFSRRDAIREHGKEAVTAAYAALDQAAKQGDPRALEVVSRIKQSDHPFDDIVGWHKETTTFNEVAKAGDLGKWFETELERRLADPQFASAQLQKIQQAARDPGSQRQDPIVRLPPSLGRVPAAQAASEEQGDLSNDYLFRSARA